MVGRQRKCIKPADSIQVHRVQTLQRVGLYGIYFNVHIHMFPNGWLVLAGYNVPNPMFPNGLVHTGLA